MQLSHIDSNNAPTMVDVSEKVPTLREATARAIVRFPPDVIISLENGELSSKKGPVFATAIIAGTMAAKKTADIIPFCHALPLDSCRISTKIVEGHQLEILCIVKTRAATGVEMEAILGATIAAVTVYDMCKALTHTIRIEQVELIAKSGGKHDYQKTPS